MKAKICSVMVMIMALVAAGCSSPESRIKQNPQLFASISAPEQQLIKEGRIAIGFSPDMVKLALGEPDYMAHTTDKDGTSEIWRYQGYDYSYDYGFYGGYMGGPYWGGPGPYRYWGAYYGGWPSYYGSPTPITDYLRVTIREGRVIQINQLR